MKARAFNMIAFVFCYYVTVNGIPRIRQNDYYVDGIHNVDYDRQLFLNKDEQKEFQQLLPAERRRRLRLSDKKYWLLIKTTTFYFIYLT